VVWHPSLPLINSFNKTEAAFFSCRLCFSFHQFNLTYYIQLVLSACVAAVKYRPFYIIVKLYFSGPQGSLTVHLCCLHLENSTAHVLRGNLHYH